MIQWQDKFVAFSLKENWQIITLTLAGCSTFQLQPHLGMNFVLKLLLPPSPPPPSWSSSFSGTKQIYVKYCKIMTKSLTGNQTEKNKIIWHNK